MEWQRVLEGALEIVVAFLIGPAVVLTYLRSFIRIGLWINFGVMRTGEADLSKWLDAVKKLPSIEVDRVLLRFMLLLFFLLYPILYYVYSSEPGIQLRFDDKSFQELMLSLATGAFVGSWFLNYKTVEKWRDGLGNALNHACWGLLFCGLSYVPLVNIPLESWLPAVVRLAEPLAGSGFWKSLSLRARGLGFRWSCGQVHQWLDWSRRASRLAMFGTILHDINCRRLFRLGRRGDRVSLFRCSRLVPVQSAHHLGKARLTAMA